MPDLYVSIPLAMEWIARTGRDCEPMELGLLAAQKASMSSLCPTIHSAIMVAQTGLMRLQTVVALCRIEDSILVMQLRQEGDNIRVICNMVGLERHPFICIGEWLDLHAIISVIRSVAGPSWTPIEMCFVSTSRPVEAVHAAFPNTRVRVGQPHTSVLIGRLDLATLTFGVAGLPSDPLAAWPSIGEQDDPPDPWEFVSLMRMLIQPYVTDGCPGVALAAELVGLSTRTLQRHLKASGSSYSRIVQEARFDLACRHLGDTDTKIIDIAMMTGYESPQHFTRAFRRFTGVTPSDYRHRNADS